MDAPKQKKWVATRYWRLVFTPLLFIIILFGFYILFTADSGNTLSPQAFARAVNSFQPRVNVPAGANAAAAAAGNAGGP